MLSLVTVSAKFGGSKLKLYNAAVKTSLLNGLAAAICCFGVFFCIVTDVRTAKP